MKDPELESLRSELYRLTNWKSGAAICGEPTIGNNSLTIPVLGYKYSTEFLLNKLPLFIDENAKKYLRIVVMSPNTHSFYEPWCVKYGKNNLVYSKTLEKALLKQVIKLVKQGEIK